MNPMIAHCALAVFCRAPVPGHAKTRLIPELGAGGAAALHAQLAEQAVRIAVAAGIGPVTVWCTPDTHHIFFQNLTRKLPIKLAVQKGESLGHRMLQATQVTLSTAEAVILMGTDCPVLTTSYLHHAMRGLHDHDAVIGPAEDGGYVLLGLKQAPPEVFADVPWGSGEVMAETRRRSTALRWRWLELAMLYDVDTPTDLARWRREAAHA